MGIMGHSSQGHGEDQKGLILIRCLVCGRCPVGDVFTTVCLCELVSTFQIASPSPTIHLAVSTSMDHSQKLASLGLQANPSSQSHFIPFTFVLKSVELG